MDTTARELNQQTAKILHRVEAGESVTVTKNGRPIAVIRPHTDADGPSRPYRTDPMGVDDDAPTLLGGPADLASRTDAYLAEGFGE